MSGLRRLLATLDGLLPARSGAPGRRGAPPRPRTTLRTGPAVPALVVRAALLALCVGAAATVADGSGSWGVALGIGVVVAARPHAALLALGVAVLVGMLALTGQHWWQLPVLALLTHGLLRLGALADAVGWRGRVELAVLRDLLPGFLVVQAAAQVAVTLALLLDGAAPVPWLVVAAVAALGALGWSVLRDVARR